MVSVQTAASKSGQPQFELQQGPRADRGEAVELARTGHEAPARDRHHERELGPHHVSCDIGCHLFSILPPFNLGNTTMGYGLGAAGAAALNPRDGTRRAISVMGDGGFWHNGLTSGVGNAVFNKTDNVLLVVATGSVLLGTIYPLLIDALGIHELFAVIGGSMGGMLALEWAARYPARLFACAPICTAARHGAQNIAFHEVGRQAIMADPDWQGGAYYNTGRAPDAGPRRVPP